MLLQTVGLSKCFGKMYALKDINFEIKAGEVHGLVGENGAGKSTLIKILTGVYTIDDGSVIWDSNVVKIKNPKHSRDLGINVIHQDRQLIPSFSGIENIYLGLTYEKKLGFAIDFSKMRAKVDRIIDELGIEVPLNIPASQLSPPQQTLIEIVRAMMTECKLLILDEPTASLTDKESEILFGLIEKLKAKGTSILYVTHRMDEIFKLTERVTIFRNGRFIKTVMTDSIDKDGLVTLMSGEFVSYKTTVKTDYGDTYLSIKNLKSKDNIVKNASFDVRSGEILGIFGLGGSGRTELLESIYGYRVSEGSVELYGTDYKKRTPNMSVKNGIVLICEDRRGKALITSLSVSKNILLTTIDNYVKNGVIDNKRELTDSNEMINKLDVKTEGPNQPVSQLSGGNQQKVVFAKALMSKPKVILCDEPTQAVDVKTRAEIHHLLRHEADHGAAIVFVSSDLTEVLDVADNILIMANGMTREQFSNVSLTSEQVLAYCYVDNKRS